VEADAPVEPVASVRARSAAKNSAQCWGRAQTSARTATGTSARSAVSRPRDLICRKGAATEMTRPLHRATRYVS